MLFNRTNKQNRILPKHIAIIMDGNGRWAKKRGLPRSAGHVAGAKKFKEIARYCNKIGIKYLTVYAFSTENWKRPKDEVDGIMNLFRDYLKDSVNFKGENIKLKFIGDISGLPEDIQSLIENAENESKEATGLCVYMAVNYGGRNEIVNAVKNIISDGKSADEISEELLCKYMYFPECPDPDLIIRPSGELRLSNFLIWQSAYSEFRFDNVLWPDYSVKDIDKAVDDFSNRNRRYGGV